MDRIGFVPIMESSRNQPDKEKKTDCLSCKLISFCGLTGSGAYVAFQIKKQKGLAGKSVLAAFAIGLTYIGIARLANLYPFRRTTR